MGLILVMLATIIQNYQNTDAPKLGEAFRKAAAQSIAENLLQQFLPISSFIEEKDWSTSGQLAQYPIRKIMPLYQFASNSIEKEEQIENQQKGNQQNDSSQTGNQQTENQQAGNQSKEEQITLEMILQAEAEEEEKSPDSYEGFPIEEAKNENLAVGENGENIDGQTVPPEGSSVDLTTLMMQENQAVENQAAENQIAENMPVSLFSPHQKQMEVDMASLANYETLVKTFYTISDNTMAGSDQLNIESLNTPDMTISKDDPGPQILIYHTHSQEMFADSVLGDSSTSIVGVGQHLTDILTNQYGYQVLHHTGEYDKETRDDAYSRSLPAIEKVLEENPSIQVIIDLHRDGVAEGTHLAMDLDGRPTARFMFFNGLSRTRKTGNISYLYNENLAGNLAFSFQMQKAAVEYYPGLTRKIYLQGYRYNMHLREKSLLIELGAQTNTVEEVMNACDPLAHILDMVLSKKD